ncbi:hypothetical protein BKA64DRAFT_702153 [Cadophora sp. MPI-SDFR-AT-0126]|nr:hypothetical protein BKA64DRAFT_702153 [Leotiomycetes sp. MPI-SDFR-AT-0126]
MAELVGFTASIVAITGAAGCAAKASVKMVRIAKTLSAAREEMEEFADDIRLFSTAIDTSLDSLRSLSENPALATSPILKALLEKGGFELLIQKSGRTQKHITKAWDTAKLMQRKPIVLRKARTALKWVIRQPNILALRSELDGFKSDILLIMSSLTLELKVRCLQDSNNIPEAIYQQQLLEIKQLKGQINFLVKEIALSQKREKRWNQRQARSSTSLVEPYEAPDTLESILMDLGSSMVDESRAPSQPRPSPSSSTTTGMSHRPSEATSDASTPPSTPQSENPKSSHYTRSSSSSYRYLGKELPAGDPPLLRLPMGKQVESRVSISQEREQIRSAQVPPLRHKQGRLIAESRPNSPRQIQSISSSREIDVPEGSTPIRRPKANGYINTPNGLVVATARIATDFPEHAISAKYANSLGLSIQPHGGGSKNGTRMLANFYSKGEEVLSSGTVTLEWSGASTTPPFMVLCRVFPDQPVNLVFGTSFLERREFYANGGEDALGGEWMK